jgi:hypothetical protein
MRINLIIDGSRKSFDDPKELRKYLLSFKSIPQVQSLFIDDRMISFFGLCYFIAHGHFPVGS